MNSLKSKELDTYQLSSDDEIIPWLGFTSVIIIDKLQAKSKSFVVFNTMGTSIPKS